MTYAAGHTELQPFVIEVLQANHFFFIRIRVHMYIHITIGKETRVPIANASRVVYYIDILIDIILRLERHLRRILVVIHELPRREVFVVAVVTGIGAYYQMYILVVELVQRLISRIIGIPTEDPAGRTRHNEIALIIILYRPNHLILLQWSLNQRHTHRNIFIGLATNSFVRRHNQRITSLAGFILSCGLKGDMIRYRAVIDNSEFTGSSSTKATITRT